MARIPPISPPTPATPATTATTTTPPIPSTSPPKPTPLSTTNQRRGRCCQPRCWHSSPVASGGGIVLLMYLLAASFVSLSLLHTVDAQLGQNSPPVMYIDRDWKLSDSEPNGTVVARVQAHDDNGDTLLFGLEAHQVFRGPANALDRLPFRINERTGVVYLNESLAGRGGEVFSIYVTVSDGIVELKNEVHVHVMGGRTAANANDGGGDANGAGATMLRPDAFGPATFRPNVRNVTDLFPAFGMLPGVSPSTAGFPPGLFGGGGTNGVGVGGGGGGGGGGDASSSSSSHRQTHTYPATPTRWNDANHDDDVDESAAATLPAWPSQYDETTKKQRPSDKHPFDVDNSAADTNTANTSATPSTQSPPPTTAPDAAASHVRLNMTLVLSICGGVILVASLAAMYMCRPFLCAFGRRFKTAASKEEMTKKPTANASFSSGPMGGGDSGGIGATGSGGGRSSLNGGSSSTEDSRNSMAMHNWQGPRAFGNRYVPWDRDGAGAGAGGVDMSQQSHSQVTSQLSSMTTTTGGSLGGSTSAPSSTAGRWEFPRHRLKFFNVLGQGAFGLVWRCEATDLDGNDGISVVAVKTLKENASDIEIKDLHSELQVMKTLEPHVNVVRLLGCCTDKDPIFVILEYVSRGKLQDYLRSSRAEKHYGTSHGASNTLTSGDLTSFMYQVARGMEYLSSCGIIHRDLAARNVLITEDHTCKVADFGFARDVVTSKVYERKSEGKLPIRWMAIESLYDDIFSVKSDIWSFGILMWEIVTLGSTPYPGIAASDVMRRVRDGYRLEKPEHCRRELYNIMYYCWARDFNDRPQFGELVELLDKLLVTEMDYIELERFPDHNYYNMSSLSGEKL